jgi:hypothetical protein
MGQRIREIVCSRYVARGTAQARRKQLARAVERVAKDLGLDEGNDD